MENEIQESVEIQTKEVQVIDLPRSTISKPLVSATEAQLVWAEYQKLAQAICTPDDIQKIGDKDFKKKSFWRKIDKFFGLSLILMSEKEEVKNVLIRKKTETKKGKYGEYEKETTEVEYYPLEIVPDLKDNEQLKKTIVFKVLYRAIAPNNQYIDGDGACDTWEKGYPNSYHDARAIAHTRAKNRAISDLAGFGEVSAEEVGRGYSNGNEYDGNKYGGSNNQKENVEQEGNLEEVKDLIKEELKSATFDTDRAVWEGRMEDIKTMPGLNGMLKRVQRECNDRMTAQSEK